MAEPRVGAGLLVAVADVGRDGERVGMVGAGLREPADVPDGLAEAVGGGAFAVAVAGLAEDGAGLPAASGGLDECAEAGVQGAEAVQRPGFTVAVAGLPVQAQGLPKVVGGRFVAAQQRLDVAEVGQRAGFADPVADPPVQGQGPPVVVGRAPVAARPLFDDAQIAQGAGQPGRVTGPPEQIEGALVVPGGQPVPAQPGVGHAEIGQGVGLSGRVAEAAGRVVGMTVDRHRVGVMAAGQVAEQGGGEPDRVEGPAVRGGVGHHGDQGRPFGFQPGPGGVGFGQVRAGRRRVGHVGPATGVGGVERVHRGDGAGEVMVEQAGERSAAAQERHLGPRRPRGATSPRPTSRGGGRRRGHHRDPRPAGTGGEAREPLERQFPFYAGAALGPASGSQSRCTSGIPAVSTWDGRQWLVTAGHCYNVGTHVYAAGGNYIGQVKYKRTDLDAAFIETPTNRWTWDGVDATGYTRYLNGVRNVAVNDFTCQLGYNSKVVCNIRVTYAGSLSWGVNGTTVWGSQDVPHYGGVVVRGGDSGGPVITIDDANSRQLNGINSVGWGCDAAVGWIDVWSIFNGFAVKLNPS